MLEWRVQKNEKEKISTKQASRMAGVSPMSSVNPRQRNGIAQIRPYLCGGMAAVAAEMATFPLDTAKTRQQLQGQVGDSRWSSLRYKGIDAEWEYAQGRQHLLVSPLGGQSRLEARGRSRSLEGRIAHRSEGSSGGRSPAASVRCHQVPDACSWCA